MKSLLKQRMDRYYTNRKKQRKELQEKLLDKFYTKKLDEFITG